ncbi:MAG: hypothetical protein ACK5OU_12800 [Dolichospermum sp.]
MSMVISYGLGLLRIHEGISHDWGFTKLKYWLMQVFSFFISFSPSFGFVSDVIAYQAAIIAIAIPLSLEIISRISERYQSGVITKEFNRQWQIKFLPSLVIANALLGVTFNFLVDSKVDTGWEKILAWLIFLLFIATNFLFFSFFKKLGQYATKTKFLLDRLFDDLTQVLRRVTSNRQMSDKRLQQSQEEFISALEGIGDILVFETKNRKNHQYIIEGLKRIQDISEKFFALQNSQPGKFSKLLHSSPEKSLVALMAIVNQFIRIHEAALEVKNLEIARLSLDNLIQLLRSLSKEINHDQSIKRLIQVIADLRDTNQQNQDEFSATLSVSWYINVVFKDSFKVKYLSEFNNRFVYGIHKIISSRQTQLFKQLVFTLHESSAIPFKDNKQPIVAEIQKSVEQLSCKENNQNKQLLEKLNNFPDKFLENQLRTEEQLNHCLELIKELQYIIFHRFSSANQEEIQKQLEEINNKLVLRLFRFKFNAIVKRIQSCLRKLKYQVYKEANQTEQIVEKRNKFLDKFLENQLRIQEQVYQFLELCQKLKNKETSQNKQRVEKLNELNLLANQLRTQEQLNHCLELVKELKNIIFYRFRSVNQEEIQEQLEEINNNLVFRFKFNNLIYLMFDIGAYCIFNNRYDYIYELWTFRQPNDADAHWHCGGNDIVPRSLLDLFNLYFHPVDSPRVWDNEKHHGRNRYLDKYFLILLLREFLNSEVTTNQDRQNRVSAFQIPENINSQILSNIPYRIDRLVRIARELITESNSLENLYSDKNQLNDAIQNGLIVFLESLKTKANERLKQSSQ